MGKANVLIVDDDPEAALSLVKALKSSLSEIQFHAASTAQKAAQLFSEVRANAVVLDLHLDSLSGIEGGFALQQKLLALDATTRIVVLTGHSSVECGVRALTLGAANFLEKPANIPHLAALLHDAIVQSELKRSYLTLSNRQSRDLASVVLGKSKPAQKLREAVVYAGQTSQAILLLGETGTGKGLCAWAIHAFGRRSSAKFIRYQPTFSTPDLVNSDLFGHVKGSFTGAQTERRGLIAEANGGTLFLDEIEELPLETQVSLLGVLQDKRARRVGSDAELNTDFRLICASNDDPVRGLENGKLRKDFYHRIAHFVVNIPALRDRREDIAELAGACVARLREREQIAVYEFDSGALRALEEYSWPGNIRELESVVEGAAYRASFAARSIIWEEDLSFAYSTRQSQPGGFHEQVEAYKRRLVDEALHAHAGNQVHAARALGLDRSSLRRILVREK